MPRTSTLLRWTLTISAAALGLAWPLSRSWALSWIGPSQPNWCLHIQSGWVSLTTRYVMRWAAPTPGLTLRYLKDPDPTWWHWWFGSVPTSNLHFVPLWVPFAILAAGAAWTWRRHLRSRQRHLCPNCNYDRRGLAIDATCPECGTVPTSPLSLR